MVQSSFRLISIGILTCIVTGITTQSNADMHKMGAYEFATFFVRTLDDIESVREKGIKDMANDGPAGELAGCIRNMEAFQLALNGDIPLMKSVQLDGRVKGIPQQFARFFEMKRDLYGQMEDYCSQMVSGPKPGVDYGAVAATAPKSQLVSTTSTSQYSKRLH